MEATMSKYLTPLGAKGVGRAVNSEQAEAIRYTHDILVRAAEERLDLYMLCSCLGDHLRDKGYAEATGRTFFELLRDVLAAGGNVYILLWAKMSERAISPRIMKLLEESERNPEWGVLDIRISNSDGGNGQITHFMLAKDREGSKWYLRVEAPHERFFDEDRRDVGGCGGDVPAAIFLQDEGAREYGQKLLEMFNPVFEAVPVGA